MKRLTRLHIICSLLLTVMGLSNADASVSFADAIAISDYLNLSD